MITVQNGLCDYSFVYELLSEKDVSGIIKIYGRPGFLYDNFTKVAVDGFYSISGNVVDKHTLTFPDMVLPSTHGYYVLLVYVDDGGGYYLFDTDDLFIKKGEY